ncbi:MAG TPA: DinB family protein [Thermomicrobiaceae bacterium]|nr:DinB family protein [Thermomicrobiaceae bacterium]
MAKNVESANDALVATVERLSDAQWQAITAAEGWSIGVTAHHVAQAYPSLRRTVATIAAGGSVATTRAMLDQSNAQHAIKSREVRQDETLAELRHNGAELVSFLRELTDAQLEATGHVPLLGAAPVSVEQVIERLVLRHSEVHLESIRQTISDDAAE